MIEQLKNDLATELVDKTNFSLDDIGMIITHLNVILRDYEVKRKETSIVIYNQEVPYLVKTFIACKSIEGFSEGTLYNYTRFLTAFFFKIQKAPEEVTANDVRIYLYTYQQERKVSNRSLEKVRACLASFYFWIHAEGYIEKNPMISVNKIKYEVKPKEPCTQTDLEYLRMACKTLKQKAILEVLYSTGCRVGELVILKKSDINWDAKTVHLFGKGKKHRTSFLNAKAEVALKEYLNSRKDDNEWLFVSDRAPHNQMHVCGVQKIVREMANRAGNNINKKISCHTMRHTCASNMAQNNASIISIQKILGHASIETTTTYIHTSLDSIKADHLRAIV